MSEPLTEQSTFDDVKTLVRSFEPEQDEDSDVFKTATLLMSSAVAGQSVRSLRQFTGYPTSWIAERVARWKEAQIFRHGRFDAAWLADNGTYVDFMLDVLVGQGVLQRSPG